MEFDRYLLTKDKFDPLTYDERSIFTLLRKMQGSQRRFDHVTAQQREKH